MDELTFDPPYLSTQEAAFHCLLWLEHRCSGRPPLTDNEKWYCRILREVAGMRPVVARPSDAAHVVG